MKEAVLIFPHQLFKQHPGIGANRLHVLVEDDLYFTQYRFHQQKIVLHRASMQYFQDMLVAQQLVTLYIEAHQPTSATDKLILHLKEIGITSVFFAATQDYLLTKRIISACEKAAIAYYELDSPGFLNTVADTAAYFDSKKTYFQTDFYVAQRKQRGILITDEGKPIGGKWSFDAENREKFPKNGAIPVLPWPEKNKWVIEAIDYTTRLFGNHYGEVGGFKYPTTHQEAVDWLDDFLAQRLSQFGLYEDAMVQSETFLFHSILTPMLNIGLLEPAYIVEKTLAFAANNLIPLNALEGFIRQIIGWREFIRLVYEREGSRQRTTNFWQFTRKIPKSFWDGTTGIHPLDNVIKKTLTHAYTHHIERLMVLGNFMLLCEFDPNEVYLWFMEMYIDAYDWVMVPNVYGMTQFADGGLMTTKPYISGSNYLMKMGNWEKGEWQAIWDGLFWRFMHVHRAFFLSNPRLGMLVKTFDKMDPEKQNKHLSNAETYLTSLDTLNQSYA